jgi:peptidoglycan-associated lipoprotein
MKRLAKLLVVVFMLLPFVISGCKPKPPKTGGDESTKKPTPITTPSEVATPVPSDSGDAGIKERERMIGSLQDIHFDYDKADLKTEARDILAKNAGIIKQIKGGKIVIEGHCDERGTVEYNLALGQRRADSAKDYILTLGVDPSQITTISYGEEKPADPGHTEDSWSKNRRVHFSGASY